MVVAVLIEVRVALSPTPAFLNRLLLLAASVREFYPDAIVKAYIGQEQGPWGDESGPFTLVNEAVKDRDIAVNWCGVHAFEEWKGTRSPYIGTMNARWATPIEGDAVIIADCDVICTGRFDELLATDAVQGVHVLGDVVAHNRNARDTVSDVDGDLVACILHQVHQLNDWVAARGF